jgi:hypothetical protein
MNAAFKTRAISFFCAIARQPFNPILNVLGCSVIKILLCDVIRKKTRIGIILDVENVLRATCRFRIGKTSHTPRNLYLRAEILYSVRLAEGMHICTSHPILRVAFRGLSIRHQKSAGKTAW